MPYNPARPRILPEDELQRRQVTRQPLCERLDIGADSARAFTDVTAINGDLHGFYTAAGPSAFASPNFIGTEERMKVSPY